MIQQLASVAVKACEIMDRDKPRAGPPSLTSGITRQRGLGIIEVLVALVVVSFGVLGVAGVPLFGLKPRTSAL